LRQEKHAASSSTLKARRRFVNYRKTASPIIITHTETPHALRGPGIAFERGLPQEPNA
jgi:predicted GNAT family acetyltransferase